MMDFLLIAMHSGWEKKYADKLWYIANVTLMEGKLGWLC